MINSNGNIAAAFTVINQLLDIRHFVFNDDAIQLLFGIIPVINSIMNSSSRLLFFNINRFFYFNFRNWFIFTGSCRTIRAIAANTVIANAHIATNPLLSSSIFVRQNRIISNHQLTRSHVRRQIKVKSRYPICAVVIVHRSLVYCLAYWYKLPVLHYIGNSAGCSVRMRHYQHDAGRIQFLDVRHTIVHVHIAECGTVFFATCNYRADSQRIRQCSTRLPLSILLYTCCHVFGNDYLFLLLKRHSMLCALPDIVIYQTCIVAYSYSTINALSSCGSLINHFRGISNSCRALSRSKSVIKYLIACRAIAIIINPLYAIRRHSSGYSISIFILIGNLNIALQSLQVSHLVSDMQTSKITICIADLNCIRNCIASIT